MSSTKEGLRLGESRSAKNTLDALFGHLDLTFVVSILLSLLGIALSYDSICGERTNGTLAIVLSYPVKRSTLIISKIAAHWITLLACVTPSFLLVVAMSLGMGVPLFDLGHWVIFFLVSSLYLMVYASIGVAVSTWASRPADAMLGALFIWVILAFIAPRGIGLVVNGLRPPSRAIELAVKEEQAVSQLRGEFFKQRQEAFKIFLDTPDRQKAQDEFKNAVRIATEDFSMKRRQLLNRLWDEEDREDALREQYVRVFSIFSPTALFNEISAELAWTGYRQRDHFIREARVYDETIGRKLAESVQAYYSSTADGAGRAIVQHADIKPFLVPFQGTWTSSRLVISSIVFPAVTLLLHLGVAFTLGLLAITRMDVRS